MGYMKILFDRINGVLNFIQEKLQKMCGNSLSLEFDYADKIKSGKERLDFDLYDSDNDDTELILCLFHNKKCISSIICEIDETIIEISSKTNANYQGKKYNLFLRIALVIILGKLEYMLETGETKKFETLISRCVNSISILSMAKHFYAYNEKFDKYMRDHKLNYDTITLNDTKHFYEELLDIPSHIKDIDEQIKYSEKYIEPYDPVIMELDLTDEKIMKRALHN